MNKRYQLIQQDQRLELHDLEKRFKPLYVDFVEGKANHRRQFPGKELIAKAVGIKKDFIPQVFDATAGLGRDAFVLASLGCQVDMVERSEVVYQLLDDGLQRAIHDQQISTIAKRMHLHLGDAKLLMAKTNVDVIYLDPMYPERKKSALVKKEMRILQDINGADLDSAELMQVALNANVKRIVVKRPKGAENIAELTPNFSYNGKNTRFDVYIAEQAGAKRI